MWKKSTATKAPEEAAEDKDKKKAPLFSPRRADAAPANSPAATSSPAARAGAPVATASRPAPPTIRPVVDASAAAAVQSAGTADAQQESGRKSPNVSPRPPSESIGRVQGQALQRGSASEQQKPSGPTLGATVRPSGGGALNKQQEKEFEEMMTSMNLPAPARAQMSTLPAAQKLDLLENHKKKEKSLKVTDKGGTL